jgi:hypothetical protein
MACDGAYNGVMLKVQLYKMDLTLFILWTHNTKVNSANFIQVA